MDRAGNVTRKQVRLRIKGVILRAGSRTLELGERPLVMGILNASPDSFSDGREETLEARIARGRALLAAGADILDIGGESARGDRPAVSAEEEIARVVPLVAALAGTAMISVDTYKPAVAEAAIAAGAAIINDVSGLRDARPGRGVRARRRRAGAHAHPRGAEGHAARPRDLRRRGRRRRSRSCASGWRSRSRRGCTPSR